MTLKLRNNVNIPFFLLILEEKILYAYNLLLALNTRLRKKEGRKMINK